MMDPIKMVPESRWQAQLLPHAPSIVTLFHFIALYAMRSRLSAIAADLGAVGFAIGLPSLIYSMVQVVLALPCGHIVDHKGPRIPAAVGSVLLCVGIVSITFATHWSATVFCGLVLGIGHVLVILGTQRQAVSGGNSKTTANTVGLVMFASSGGQFMGPILGGYLSDHFGNFGFWFVAFVGLLAAMTCFMLPDHNDQKERAKQNSSLVQSVVKLAGTNNVLLTILISAVVLFCQETTLTYFPLYGDKIGLSATAVGMVLSMRGVASMVVRPFLGRLSERISLRNLIALSLLGGGISILSYATFTNYFILLLVGTVSGLFLGLAAPLTLMLIAVYAPAEQRGEAISLRIVFNYMGQGASAAVFGILSGILGYSPTFLISGGLMLSFSLAARLALQEGNA